MIAAPLLWLVLAPGPAVYPIGGTLVHHLQASHGLAGVRFPGLRHVRLDQISRGPLPAVLRVASGENGRCNLMYHGGNPLVLGSSLLGLFSASGDLWAGPEAVCPSLSFPHPRAPCLFTQVRLLQVWWRAWDNSSFRLEGWSCPFVQP